ncbi:MAG: hypothetical protein HRU38_16110 [Saccharospirillaceae bacterium]|nr:hypothetical protein [Pseudomonadales bacterium]NRB80167.1 hypothetical protein [Saccharospirillaceae bacterium]
MNGLDDGTYYLKPVGYNGSQELCQDINLLICSGKQLCDGFSQDCITVVKKNNKENSTWKINARQMAAGNYFFDANVKVQLTFSTMSILAAGDINTTNKVVMKAMNTATYDELCLNNFSTTYEINRNPSQVETFTPRSNSNITGFYPKNYCNDATQTVKNDVLGNAVLMSGGIRDDLDPLNTTFTGGDIYLNNLSILFGSVVAGDNLKTSGLTIIHGYLVTLDTVDDRLFDNLGNLIQKDENTFGANISIINDGTEEDGFDGQLAPFIDCENINNNDTCIFENYDTTNIDYNSENNNSWIFISDGKYL